MELMTRARERSGASKQLAPRWFTTTQSSIIRGVKRGDRQVAFPALCQAYWQAVFTFICAIGCNPDDARDVTQGLFESMLRPGFFDRFDPSLGRFRGWLRTVARRSYFNWKRDRLPELAAVERAAVEESVDRAANPTSDADRAFDRALTEVVVRRALERLRLQYAEDGEEELFSQLRLAVIGERQRSYDAAVSKIEGTSISMLKKERLLAREEWTMRYKGCLREELAALGVSRACIEKVVEELRDASR
jgi:DNA-directed RNA polymerase specialized sigma24 family protein